MFPGLSGSWLAEPLDEWGPPEWQLSPLMPNWSAASKRVKKVHSICWYQSGHLLTRPEDRTILPGITRKLIFRCASQMELPTREARILKDQLVSADEVFVCSSAIEVLSVVRVDDQPIGDGRPGPITARLYDQIRRELGIGNPSQTDSF